MKIYVGGINAVGKSSIVKEAADRLGFEYIHATSGLLQYLGFKKDYEKLRALTQHERDIKLGEYMVALLKQKPTESFLVDGHYLGLVRGEINKITGPWLKDFDILALISAPMEHVWQRIKIDEAIRDRALFVASLSDTEKKNALATYQEQTLEEFYRLASLYNKSTIEILNEEGKKDTAVDKLVEFVLKAKN